MFACQTLIFSFRGHLSLRELGTCNGTLRKEPSEESKSEDEHESPRRSEHEQDQITPMLYSKGITSSEVKWWRKVVWKIRESHELVTRLVQYCYYLAVLSLRDKSILFKIWLMSCCCHFGSVFINIPQHETPLHWVPYQSICTRKSRNPGRKTIRKKK